MATIDYENKHVTLREKLGEDIMKTSFDKYKSKDEKQKVKKEATEFYNELINNNGKASYRTIDSQLSSITYYYEEYSNQHYERGEIISENAYVKKYNMEYNPYYYKIFIKRLLELGKKNNTYVDVSIIYNEESQMYYIVGKVLSKEQFESLYGISLDQFYELSNKNDNNQLTSLEEMFKEELVRLKKNYISYMIEDINSGHDKGFIEIDGYQAYLQLAYKYPSIENKEDILREVGFELDNENNALRLVETTLKLKQ